MRGDEGLDALEGLALDESSVLGVVARPGRLTFRVEFVLTLDHPDYRPADPGRSYFPRRGVIDFTKVTRLAWARPDAVRPGTDATGEVDYGNIDVLTSDGTGYHLSGDFGAVDVASDPPTVTFDPTLTDDELSWTVDLVLAGDVRALDYLLAVPQYEIVRVAGGGRRLTVTAAAVASVLRQLHLGRVDAGRVQRWADFVRHGNVVGSFAPAESLDIHDEQGRENRIGEIIERLRGIGKFIDPVAPDAEEISAMMATLGES